MRQLTALDRMFLTQESPGAPMHISLLMFYTQRSAPDGAVRLRDIVQVFRERAHLVPMLHEKVQEVPFGLDNPYWVADPDLNVESHISHVALPHPGDWRQLCILAARLHARGVDRSRPLWELVVIEGLDGIDFLPKGSFALFLKMHHAAVDGVAALNALEVLHDEHPRKTKRVSPQVGDDEPGPGTNRMLGNAGLNALRSPARWWRLAKELVPAVRFIGTGVREGRFGTASPRVNTRFNTRISSYRVVESAFFALDELQLMRKAESGATVNDVVVTIIGGAMRRYLQSRGELGDSSPVTIAPLSFREAGEREFGGNLVSAVAFPIHTVIEDPLERLHAVRRDSAVAKETAKALGPRTALDLFEAIPPQLAALGFLSLGTRLLTSTGIATPVNTVITNVPGPRIPLYLAGARLVSMTGFGPIMDSMGLFHAVISYDGQLSIAINSCREMMPDPAFYAECIYSSFEELRAAAAMHARKPAARKATTVPRRAKRRSKRS
ncbi:MAG: wax ester/triacylglycerol synthase family O-acyltransferase [Gammaproteobacteria bacterium]|nr:wax ester/triacylglycerol synthase family O-acyltransferase [Gammaproteobacteria bacterium]